MLCKHLDSAPQLKKLEIPNYQSVKHCPLPTNNFVSAKTIAFNYLRLFGLRDNSNFCFLKMTNQIYKEKKN
ncbi:hypothetical protein VIGAN_10169400 [Vigna angularis var. angularis]|uniref:Uncharacterized protein n=1 Tax=Vigna angularis var. angularis TaxID=157739 RepID=A0A0S3T4W3_PHAAN|nr:hypothetical protein VIGAN_10169400 [Vigna angularis var. angularis]